jgi:hypothetical protein
MANRTVDVPQAIAIPICRKTLHSWLRWKARRRNVLKISITETAAETRWVLQGRVFGSWVSELSAIWRTSTRTRKGRTCIVDLDAVTFIDKGAEKLLRTMAREGAEFIADGLYIKNVFGKPKVIGRRGLSETLAAFLRFSRRATRTMNTRPAP